MCASKGDKVNIKPACSRYSRYKEGDNYIKLLILAEIELSKELSNIYENVYSKKKILIDAKLEFAVSSR